MCLSLSPVPGLLLLLLVQLQQKRREYPHSLAMLRSSPTGVLPPHQDQQTLLLAQLTLGREDPKLREEGGEKSVQGPLSSPRDLEGRGPD